MSAGARPGRLPREIWLILVGYLLLAALNAIVTPPFEKPDEPWHFAFSMHLVETGTLPVQRTRDRDHLAEQEGSQPPFYYALHAAVLELAGLDTLRPGFEHLTTPNPFYGVREGAQLENANQYVRLPCDGVCRETRSAVMVGRGLSIAFGALALLAAAGLLAARFPARPALAVAVTGAIAFLPQFLHLASSVSNDVATVAMVNLTLLLAFRWWRRPASLTRAAWVGLAAGLATLAKASGMSIALVAGLFLLLAGARPLRARLATAASYTLAFAALTGWWFWRNVRLYGEPTATRIHLDIYGVGGTPLTLARARDEWERVANTLWASFGWGSINLPHPVYAAARWVALALALLFLVEVGRRWRGWDRGQRWLVGLAMLQLGVVGALLARWMRLTEAPLGRLLFPALLPITLVLAFGALALVPARLERLLVRGIAGGWALASTVLLVTLIRPAYTPAPLRAALPEGAIPLVARFGESIELAGYEVERGPHAPGETVMLTLYWRAIAVPEESLAVGVKLFGRNGEPIARSDSLPDGGRRPTTGWPPGVLVPDRVHLPVDPDATVPVLAPVEIDLYRPGDLSWLPVTIGDETVRPFRPLALELRAPDTAPVAIRPWPFRVAAPTVTLDGERVALELEWEVGQPIDGDYRLFFHLAPDVTSPPLAQVDVAPIGGALPTGYWQPGDRLADRVTLALPAEAPPGRYVLLVGLYDPASGTRLAGEGARTEWPVGTLDWDGTRWRMVAGG